MLHLFLVIVGIGLLDYLILQFVPLEEKFKQLVHILALVAAVIYTLQALGVLDGRVQL